MSIAALHELSTETRRLAIAGASLAPGDFRLQKLIEPLQKSGEKSPVFAKVAGAVKAVVEADEKTAPKALLDLSSLTNAILYTQGKTGNEGELETIETSPVEGTTTHTSYRILAPLIEALTQTGQGRYEVVADAVKRGAFRDIRLVRPAIVALGDRYGELATLVTEEVLPSFGPGIADLLANDLDPKGGVIHARRMRALAKVDPDRARKTARQVMAAATKEVRIAALEALKGSEHDADLILGEVTAKVKDVRRAAFAALAGIKHETATELLGKAVGSADLELIAETVDHRISGDLVTMLIVEGEKNLQLALEKNTASAKVLGRVRHVLKALSANMTGKAEEFLLAVFGQRDVFSKLPKLRSDADLLNEQVAGLMCTVASDKTKRLLIKESHSLPESQIAFALIAASQTETPKAVFKTFGSLLTDKKRGDHIEQVISSWRYHHHDLSLPIDWSAMDIQWDKAWLRAAIKADRPFLVCHLLNGTDRAAENYLLKKIDLKTKSGLQNSFEFLKKLADIGHKGRIKLILDAVTASLNSTGYFWGKWQYLNLISELPTTALKEIEAFVKKLPEKQMEEVLPYLAELKAKTASTKNS